MTLDQLRMLVQVEESGSVLAAAEALYRTQPTVSVAIRKLEDELGLQLLSRDRYRATLTPSGEQFCRQARVLIKQADDMKLAADYMAAGFEPQLNIAIEASCPMPYILDVLKKIEQQYPQTRINLMAENIWGALTRLKEGEADIAVSPWFDDDTSLESFTLLHETMLAVASPDFPPLLSGRQLNYGMMKETVQVIVKDSSRNPKEKKLGVLEEGRHWLVNDHYTKKEILLAGMGWGRLQQHLIRRELQEGTLVPLQISRYESSIDIEIRVARRLGSPAGPVASELWQMFMESVET
jgi:DNA-binding transcriptional LysR family regulator